MIGLLLDIGIWLLLIALSNLVPATIFWGKLPLLFYGGACAYAGMAVQRRWLKVPK